MAAQLIVAKVCNQPGCPSAGEWVKKMWSVYTVEFCSVLKNEIRSSCRETDETVYHLVKQSKSESERQNCLFLLCVQSRIIHACMAWNRSGAYLGKQKGISKRRKRKQERMDMVVMCDTTG